MANETREQEMNEDFFLRESSEELGIDGKLNLILTKLEELNRKSASLKNIEVRRFPPLSDKVRDFLQQERLKNLGIGIKITYK